MTPRLIRIHCKIDSKSERMLEDAIMCLASSHAYDRILKISRTIADPDGSDRFSPLASPKQLATARWIARTGRDGHGRTIFVDSGPCED
jgi:predicted ATPase with chaperone activity